MLPLPDLQRAFFHAVSAGHDDAAAPELLAAIRGDERLAASERLAVYARMYCARLVDVLREDYPRVAAVLGNDDFADLTHAYLAAHPSTHPSLRWFGRSF